MQIVTCIHQGNFHSPNIFQSYTQCYAPSSLYVKAKNGRNEMCETCSSAHIQKNAFSVLDRFIALLRKKRNTMVKNENENNVQNVETTKYFVGSGAYFRNHEKVAWITVSDFHSMRV